MAARTNVLSRAQIEAIGRLVVNATRLESIILDLLCIFMKCDAVSAVIGFHGQQFSSKVSTLKALYSVGLTKKECETDPMLAKLSKASTLADFRNTIVHAYWVLDDDGSPLAVRYDTKGYFRRQRRPIPTQEIRGKAREVAALEQELRALRDHLLKHPPSPAGG